MPSHITKLVLHRATTDGRLLVTADLEGSVHVWNLETLSSVRHFTVPEHLLPSDIQLVESGSHALAVTEETGELIWWNLELGTTTRLGALPVGSRYDSVSMAPEPSLTIIATTQGADVSAFVWRRQPLNNGAPEMVGRTGPVPTAPWFRTFFAPADKLFVMNGLLAADHAGPQGASLAAGGECRNDVDILQRS